MKRSPMTALAGLSLVLLLAACGDDDSKTASTSAPATTAAPMETAPMETSPMDSTAQDPGTIVDIAAGNPDFSTLVSAVQAAGLADTLSGDGPFTVFAPTNEAFAAIPSDQLDAILADKAQLAAILTYHVLAGTVMSTDLQPTQSVPTVQGSNVDIEVANGKATINGCNIVATDIVASNGVIHVIDCVLVPPAS